MKVAVIGAGNVGAVTALRIAEADLADVVLVDVVQGIPQGKALDLTHAKPLVPHDRTITGGNDFAAIAGSEIVIVTAGMPRKPGMSRDDLLDANAQIVRQITEQVKRHAPQAILLIVTNPLDVMTGLAYRVTSFEARRVIGMAGVLDAARFNAMIAETLHVSVANVRSLLLGGHGDLMLPLPRYTTVSGIPLTDLLSRDQIESLVQQTRDAGATVVKLLGSGSAYFAPAAAIAAMVRAIIQDTGDLCCASVLLTGQYGLRDLFIGVPVRLGRSGVTEIIELSLTEAERTLLHQSADSIREGLKRLGV
jgi:malate dehydrogenase